MNLKETLQNETKKAQEKANKQFIENTYPEVLEKLKKILLENAKTGYSYYKLKENFFDTFSLTAREKLIFFQFLAEKENLKVHPDLKNGCFYIFWQDTDTFIY